MVLYYVLVIGCGLILLFILWAQTTASVQRLMFGPEEQHGIERKRTEEPNNSGG